MNEEVFALGNPLETRGPALLIWPSDGSHDTISQGRGQLVCETRAIDSHWAHGLIGAQSSELSQHEAILGSQDCHSHQRGFT